MTELVFAHGVRGGSEDSVTEACCEALRASRSVGSGAMGDLLCGTLVASMSPEAAGSAEEWLGSASRALAEVEEAVPGGCEGLTPEAVIEALRAGGVVDWQWATGSEVLAVLEEDQVRASPRVDTPPS